MLASLRHNTQNTEIDTSIKRNLHNLDRFLSRLEKNVLSEKTADVELRKSVYLRRKTSTNVEYARSLLVNLRHDVANSKSQTTIKQELERELQKKGEVVVLLERRLMELDRLDNDEEEDQDDVIDGTGIEKEVMNQPPIQDITLRQRRVDTSEKKMDTKTSDTIVANTSTSTSTSKNSQTSTNQPSTESLLESQQLEQSTIQSSLLTLSKALKQSNINFAQTLEAEKSILDRAFDGLDKNAKGMEVAESKMGVLRKMTEGKGWWGRIKLYLFIAGMWTVGFLLVFVGPKLRF